MYGNNAPYIFRCQVNFDELSMSQDVVEIFQGQAADLSFLESIANKDREEIEQIVSKLDGWILPE